MRLIGLIRSAAASLFPGYFAVVMATGATSIALNLMGHDVLALALLAANCLAYGFLWLLTAIRVVWYPASLVEDMMSHARGRFLPSSQAPASLALNSSFCLSGIVSRQPSGGLGSFSGQSSCTFSLLR